MTSHMVSPSAERHRRQQSADRKQEPKSDAPRADNSRRGVRGKFRQRPTLPHGNRAVPSALEGLTPRSVWEGGTTGDRSSTEDNKAPTGSLTKSDAPRRGHSRGGASGENSGSDLLSHTETVQYHRLWRA